MKNENEYVLTFFIGNDLHDLAKCMSYEVFEQKYQNLHIKTCNICFEDVNILCRCKYCRFKMCKDCIMKLEFFICPCLRNDQFFLNFERSILIIIQH